MLRLYKWTVCFLLIVFSFCVPHTGQAQVSAAIVSTHSATLEIPVMTRALPLFGFKAEGFAANWDQLTRLKIPVIVYLKHRKNDHFSVLRGINKDTVFLADPSMGNRTYSRHQFLAMWQTRHDIQNADLSGKFLAVLPMHADIRATDNFFTKTPVRQTTVATQSLATRWQPN
jgi:predicted double-glycine peptidase